MLMLINFGIFHVLWMIVLLMVSGFLAVLLYHRRSGEYLSVRSGARMGWMTAVFTFLIFLIPTLIGMGMQWRRGTLSETLREQAQNQPISEAQMQEMLRLFESPAAFVATLLLAAALAFVFFIVLAVIGGALGAKVLERD